MSVEKIIKTSQNIAWDSLESHYNRTCEYIPDVLAGLSSDDQQHREKTYWKFDNHVVVQSGLYNGAFYVIPFIIQLLKENMKHNRHNPEIYELLFQLGNGFGTGDVEFSIQTNPFTYFIPKKGGIRWALSDACHDAVFSGWNLYYEELMNKNSPNRKYALELIASFYKHHIISRNIVMQQIIDSEPNSEIGRIAAEYLDETLYPYTAAYYPEDFQS